MFFVFKQKTAYEMRISDWSSDVCSSDLVERTTPALGFDHDMAVAITAAVVALAAGGALGLGGGEQQEVRHVLAPGLAGGGLADEVGPAQCRQDRDDHLVLGLRLVRSEAHTSEIQSLMRISYAVFC